MTDTNPNPAPAAGQDPNNPNPAPGPAGGAPSGGHTPPAAGNDQPSGGVNTQPAQQLSQQEINDLKRKAGRWDKHVEDNRKNRRLSRQRSRDDYNADDADPALLDALKDRDSKIDELSSTNVKLAVKDQVRDLLDSDEYKDLPQGIRRAITRNPLGFASPSAQSVEEAVADIQDYLDDELDRMASNPPAQGGGQPPATPPGQPAGTPPGQPPASPQTPPAAGSGPSNPQVDVNQGIDGKVGSKRSTQVLNNILKGPKR